MLIVAVIDKFAPKLLPWSVRFYESRGTGVVYDIGFYLGLVGNPCWSTPDGRAGAEA